MDGGGVWTSGDPCWWVNVEAWGYRGHGCVGVCVGGLVRAWVGAIEVHMGVEEEP